MEVHYVTCMRSRLVGGFSTPTSERLYYLDAIEVLDDFQIKIIIIIWKWSYQLLRTDPRYEYRFC